ncbi:hypothetical protein RRG08_032122 [Elysia crispata]|uniref:Uncharacterized protein n=1 Tax=Elysia crispata TaxID=231223 RepID=A0AAE1DEE6_9GAST|nr:hypothetical protein RRG08_032122 [Elysia crispata]
MKEASLGLKKCVESLPIVKLISKLSLCGNRSEFKQRKVLPWVQLNHEPHVGSLDVHVTASGPYFMLSVDQRVPGQVKKKWRTLRMCGLGAYGTAGCCSGHLSPGNFMPVAFSH